MKCYNVKELLPTLITWRETGLTYRIIARRLDRSEYTVRDWFHKYLPHMKRISPVQAEAREKRDLLAVEKYKAGGKVTEIAKELGTHHPVIYAALHRAGVVLRGERYTKFSREEAWALRCKGLSYRKIAIMLGVDRSSIIKGLKPYKSSGTQNAA